MELLCSLLPSCYPLVPCFAPIITEVELSYTFPDGTPVEAAMRSPAMCIILLVLPSYHLCHFLVLVGIHNRSAPHLGSFLTVVSHKTFLTKPKLTPWEVALRLPALSQ